MLPVPLVIAAGLALILQNLVMGGVVARTSSLLVALVLNSAVGIVLLGGLLLWQGGWREGIATFRLWYLVPGLLGSFFVFASLTGYQTLGPSRTIAVLVASQLVFGLGADLLRGGRIGLAPVVGVGLLVAGASLVLMRRA